MPPPFEAYQGDEPYLFASYSHADSDEVFKELVWLRDQGFNIWYDEGISPGESWRNEIAAAISNCSLFVIFISPNSAHSGHCLREVNFAQNRGRQTLAIHLQETTLSDELEFNLSDRQALMRYSLSEQDYCNKLLSRLRVALNAAEPEPVVTPSVEPVASQFRAIGLAVAAMVLMVTGGLAYTFLSPDAEPVTPTQQTTAEDRVPEIPATTPPENSIAVLPFENLSPSADNAYFAAGVHEDLLLSLAKIDGLTVIARKSVQRYARSDLSVSEIGQELNVATVLEGSVRRAGDKVRVSISLIDVATSATVWGETYDRTLTDIFAIQSDIATQVTSELKLSLDLNQQQQIASVPTSSISAYELYLQSRTTSDRETALELLDQAVLLDPTFSDAHAAIALRVLGQLSLFGSHAIDYERARIHADRAYELTPESVDALRAQARLYASQREADRAESLFRKALALYPSHAPLIDDYSYHLVYRGDIREAYEWLRKLLVLDPNATESLVAMADLLTDDGRRDEIVPYLERAQAAADGDPGIMRSVAGSYFRAGMFEESIDIRAEIVRQLPNSIPEISSMASTAAFNGDPDAAEKWVARLRKLSPPLAEVLLGGVLNASGNSELEYELAKRASAAYPEERAYRNRMAYAASVMGLRQLAEEREDLAQPRFEEALALLDGTLVSDMVDGEVELRPDNTLPFVVRAVVLATLGEKALAAEYAQQYLAFSDRQPTYRLVNGHFLDALAKLIAGDREGAMDSFSRIDTESHGFVFAYWFDVFAFDINTGVFGNAAEDIRFIEARQKAFKKQQARLAYVRANHPGIVDATLGLKRL